MFAIICMQNPTLTFDNKKDIDCMRAHHDFTALSELNQVTVLFFFIDCILLMCTRCMLSQEKYTYANITGPCLRWKGRVPPLLDDF
jgi:hypothetical protein